MSHSYGAIRFENGDIFHIEFNGTVDVCLPSFYNTLEEARQNWRTQKWDACECKPIKKDPVEIAVTYGSGWTWNGFACRKCMVITDRFEPFPINEESGSATDGLPKWYPNQR